MLFRLLSGLILTAWLAGCATTTVSPGSEARLSGLPGIEEGRRVSVARDLFLKGLHQEFAGNPQAALDFFRIARNYDPASRELAFFLAEKYRERGEVGQALACARQGLALKGEERAGELKLAAELFLRSGDLERGLQHYERALALRPGDRDALYAVAAVYQQRGDLEKQASALERLLPEIGWPERMVEETVLLRRALRQEEKGGGIYRLAWEETGYDFYGERLAESLERQGAQGEALGIYRDLYRKDEANPYYRNLLARSFLGTGDADSAETHYRQLVSAYPENEEYSFALGSILFTTGRYDEARACFAGLLRRNAENPVYHFYLGYAAEMLGDEDLAELEYGKAILLNPDITEYWGKLGFLLLEQKAYGKVRDVFARLNAQLPSSAEAWFLSGVAMNRMAEDLEREAKTDTASAREALEARRSAVESFRRNLSLKPGEPRALFQLGVALERSGHVDESIETFKKLVKIDTGNVSAFNYLGYMLVESGKELDAAGRYIDRALAREPGNGAYLDSKGWWFYKKKNYLKAREYLEMAIDTGVQDVVILEHLALVLEELGDLRSAREQWSAILKLDPGHRLAHSKLN